MEKHVFNTILVHVSRVWERVRLTKPYQEMYLDNIESVDAIVEIADKILMDDVIQKFIGLEDRLNWDWSEETSEDTPCSDIYIENLAHDIIHSEYEGNV